MTETKHVLRILNYKGDVQVAWSPTEADEVAKAQAKYDALLGEGYLTFTVPAPGAKPTQIRQFDPEAFEIIAVPRFVGG